MTLLAAGAGLPSAGLPRNGPPHAAQTSPGTAPSLRVHWPQTPLQRPQSPTPTGRESGPSQRAQPQPPQTPSCLACTGWFSGSLLPLAEPRELQPPPSPARAALPLGHQVAHSQGAQESLTGEGQPTCCPSCQYVPPPRCRWGCPQSGRKANSLSL